MAEFRAKVSEKYQIQIPKGVRDELQIERGDRLLFRVSGKKLVVKVEKSGLAKLGKKCTRPCSHLWYFTLFSKTGKVYQRIS